MLMDDLYMQRQASSERYPLTDARYHHHGVIKTVRYA